MRTLGPRLWLAVALGVASLLPSITAQAQPAATPTPPPVAASGAASTTLRVEVGDEVTVEAPGARSRAAGRHSWVITSKPAGSAARLSRNDVARPTLVPDVEGDYLLQVTTVDGTTRRTDIVRISAFFSTPYVTVLATDPLASEVGPNSGTFTFARTGSTAQPLTVAYSAGGTAQNGVDYAPPLPGTVVIPVGQRTASVTLTPVGDGVTERIETVVVRVSESPNYRVVWPGTAVVLITGDAEPQVPVISITAPDPNASEAGSDPGRFTVTRTGSTAAALGVSYSVGGSASNGADFTPALSGAVTIPSGASSADIPIVPVDDAANEGSETVTLTLQAAAGYALGAASSATVTILDNDAPVELPVVQVNASDPSASEAGTEPGTITFSRSGPTGSALTVHYAITGSATNGSDFTPSLTGSITILAAQASALVTVTPVDDAAVEGSETVVLTLVPAAAYSIGAASSATVTIADNDSNPALPEVTVSATDATAAEAGSDTRSFTFARTGPTTGDLTVQFAISGNATNGVDFTPSLTGTVVIPSGQSSTAVTITPANDTAVEGPETVVVTLVASAQYTLGASASATVTIADDDLPEVTVVASDAVASEAGPDAGAFTVSRTGPTTAALVVQYSVSGTAAGGSDYAPALTGTVTIAVGQSSTLITITPVDDSAIEGPESVTLTLSATSAYTVGAGSSATVTIADNDLPAVTVEATDAAASEAGSDPGTFTISRTGPTTGTLAVQYSVGGSATNGTDYTPNLSGTITIPTGSSSTVVTISPVDDGDVEGAESVTLTLTAGAGYTVGAAGSATVTIADNDLAAVSVAAADGAVAEAGQDPGVFTFTRTGPTTSALTVQYAVGGTATAATDYLPTLTGSITIPSGQSSVDLTLTPQADNLVEPAESVILTVQAAAGYAVGAQPSATVAIADDPAVVTLAVSDPAAAESGDTGAFTVTRSGGNLASVLVVDYTLSGTATEGVDYVQLTGTIAIPANQTSAIETIPPLRDNAVEGAETVILTLVVSPTYTISGAPAGTVTIDDDPVVIEVGATDSFASEEGPDAGTLVISRSGGDTSLPVQVAFARGGTAAEGTDYQTLASSPISIPANQTSVTFSVVPVADGLVEGDETVVLTITPSAGYVVGASASGTVTIHDATGVPLVSVSATDSSASESGPDTGKFRFTRSGDTSAPLSVAFSVSGTATNGTDYSSIASPVVIPVGQSSVDLVLTPTADAASDGAETVIVTLLDGAPYDIGSPAAATITIDDAGGGCGPEGGPMVNGWTHCGTISNASEVDTWTFTATAGDRFDLVAGELVANSSLVPWIRVFAPDGSNAFCGASVAPASLCSNWSTVGAQLEGRAPLTGTYLVLFADNTSNHSGVGTYRLTMTRTPGPITVAPGDEGGPLTNGFTHTGDIPTGDLDVWTFTATAGDRFDLVAGELVANSSLVPWIRVFAPDGSNAFCGASVAPASLCSNWSTVGAQLEGRAPLTGTYLVLFADNTSNHSGVGTYRLTMTRTPGPITVAPGDEGGPLTNGFTHTGDIPTGDLDVWTFTATAGDRFDLVAGELVANSSLVPWIRVFAPDGSNAFCGASVVPASLCSNWSTVGAQLEGRAPLTGTYLVLFADNTSNHSGVGTYRLTMTRTPGPITVAPGDEGGPLTNGFTHTGDIPTGDLDVWTFTATAGDRFDLVAGELVANSSLVPWIRVFAPDGSNAFCGASVAPASLCSNWSTVGAQLEGRAPLTGTYLVLFADNTSNHSGVGTYRLTMTFP